MFKESEATEHFLCFINEGRAERPPFKVYSIELSEKEDFWIIGSNVIDPYPQYGGVYGYLLNNKTGEVIVCGCDQSPKDYIQDLYDVETANGKNYVLRFSCNDEKRDLIDIKNSLGINYQQARFLVRERQVWFLGIKRHLSYVKKELEKNGIHTEIIITNKNDALIDIEEDRLWLHPALKMLYLYLEGK